MRTCALSQRLSLSGTRHTRGGPDGQTGASDGENATNNDNFPRPEDERIAEKIIISYQIFRPGMINDNRALKLK